ncbi:MAG TPA: MBL fold metallo-hydrolase [Ruminiclostridium sp.]|nr:MBL fold metallo-hydrolase [Ruminiclostridium sp.]
MFIKCLKVGIIETNCYIACDKVTNKAVIIDPGADAPRIVTALNETGCTAEYVLLTHGHADHMAAAHEVAEKTGAKIGVYSEELDFLNNPEINGFSTFGNGDFVPFTPDLLFKDGDTLIFGGLEIRVLHTPGHTRGSCCYITQDTVFSGDTLFRETAGRTDLPTGSADELMDSLKRVFELEGDLQVLPGHGEFTTLDYERQNNPFNRSAR